MHLLRKFKQLKTAGFFIKSVFFVYYAQKQLKTFVQKNNEFFKSFC